MTACPLCRTTGSKPTFSFLRPKVAAATGRPTEQLYGRAGPLVRCTSCGLVRQDPPADAPYEDAEDPEYLAEEEGIRVTFRRTLATIERFKRPPGRLLDVGCGPGFLIEEAKALGWDAVGAELSAWAVTEASRRGLDVQRATLDQLDIAPGSVDVIVLADVIEHVPDPVATMTRVNELLRAGGVVFLATPNVDSFAARLLRRWWWSVLPGHLWLFSTRTLHRLLERTGFEVLETSTHPKTFSLAYYLGRLGGYSSRLGGTLRATELRRLVTPDLRDRVAVLAAKR